MALAMVAVADKIQRTDLFAQFIRSLIRDVPYHHAVRLVTQHVMVGHQANAADHSSFKHTLRARHHFLGRNVHNCLGGKDNTAVYLIERCFWCYTANLSPITYFLILSMSYTG